MIILSLFDEQIAVMTYTKMVIIFKIECIGMAYSQIRDMVFWLNGAQSVDVILLFISEIGYMDIREQTPRPCKSSKSGLRHSQFFFTLTQNRNGN